MDEYRLGICTRYYQNEVTYSALHLAEEAISLGVPVSILARDVCRREASAAWDHKVIQEHNTESFIDWAFNLSHLLWTAPPSLEEIEWANERGIKTLLLAVWDELQPSDQAAVCAMTHVISPYDCVTRALHELWGVEPTFVEMAWDVPLPITVKRKLHREPWIRLLFPLMDSQARRSDQTVFEVIHRVLEADLLARVTVAVGRNWAPSSKGLLRWLQKVYGERISVEYSPSLLRRVLLYAHHDLTVWPTKYEGLATVGLSSLCMGTPVLAWDIDPLAEFVQDEGNGILVPCEINENWLGVPEVQPRWKVFEGKLLELLQHPEQLATIRGATSNDLEKRRADFRKGWKSIWG